MQATEQQLTAIYNRLYDAYGPQHWWPGDTPFEIAVGAILTQGVSWSNVEKAIGALKRIDALSPEAIASMDAEELAPHIRSTLYFNMKARKLQAFCRHLLERCGGDMDALKERPIGELRTELLGLYGIGPETADSILLYAVGMPIFVVDAYTRRIFSRYGIVPPDIEYHDLQAVFMERLPADTAFFNEYHALIVMLGKACCTARKPRCSACPLREDCRRRYL